MATQTPNLGLKKPAGTDYVLVGDLNENSDKIDDAVGKLSNLNTSIKTNLVAAINEARTTGGENPPYVGEDGYWYAWDIATTQYINSGTKATGAGLEYDWNGTELGVKRETDAEFAYVDLQGPPGQDGTGAGDMTKAVYDQDNDGIVDNAEKLGGQLPSYYAIAKAQKTSLDSPVQDNAEYRLGTYNSATLTINLPSSGNYECWIRFTAGASMTTLAFSGGTATWLGLPVEIEAGLTYELSIKDGYVIGAKEYAE